MAKEGKYKQKIGLMEPGFAPVASEPANSHPTYGDDVTLGHAVRAYLTLITAGFSVYGDDAEQMNDDLFVRGDLDMETLLSSLDRDALLYGAKREEDGEVTDSADDMAANGAVHYIQSLLMPDKTIVYRAVFLYLCSADRSSYADESDTRADTLDPKKNPVKFKIYRDETGNWRSRKEFASLPAARAWVQSKLTGAASDEDDEADTSTT